MSRTRRLILALLLLKGLWLAFARTGGEASLAGADRADLVGRLGHLEGRLLDPAFFDEAIASPGGIFEGEWRLVSLSMTAAAATNLAQLDLLDRTRAVALVDALVARAREPAARAFDQRMWGSDALATLDRDEGHVGYLGHLAFMTAARLTLGEDAARRAAWLAYDLEVEGRLGFFAWPSVGTYGGDEVRVLRAAASLRTWLVELASEGRRVPPIPHSLGARAVTAALSALALEETAPRLGELILVAPDVDADEFVRDVAPQIRPFVARITVYASANERALHHDLDEDALGDTAHGVRLDPRFETIDASAVDTSLLGHAFDGSRRSVVSDIDALLAGRSRERLEQHLGDATYWTLEGPPMGGPR